MNRALHVCLSFCFMVLFLDLSAQDHIRISGNYKDEALTKILDQWEKDYGLIFNYDASRLSHIQISTRIKNQALEPALEKLLRNTHIRYQILEKGQIILSPIAANPKTNQRTRSMAVMQPQLRGLVVGDSANQVLPFAGVHIKNGHVRTLTDAEGNFSLPYRYRKGDTLVVSYVGYESKEIPLTPELVHNTISIELISSPLSLSDVLIEEGSNQTIAIADGASQISINPEKVALLSGLGEPDILRSLQLLPGVGGAGESASNLAIRGGTPDQTLVMLDGITIYQAGHFFGLLGAFNSHAIKDVTLYRGGLSARYGGRVSGVVDITGKPLAISNSEGGLNLNLMNSSAWLEAPVFNGKGALMIAGRRSFSEIIQSSLYKSLFSNISQQGVIQNIAHISQEEPANQYSFHPAFHFFDLNVKLSYQPTKRDLLSISLYKGSDELDYTITASDSTLTYQTKDQLSLSNRGLGLNWSRQWTDRFYSKVNASFSHFQSDYSFRDEWLEGNTILTALTQKNELEDMSLRFDNQWTISPANKVSFGAQLSTYKINNLLSSELTGVAPSVNEWASDASLRAAYMEYHFSPSEKWSVNPGIRFSQMNEPNSTIFPEPRFSIYFKPSTHWSFKAAAGQYNQFINRVEIFNPFRIGEDFWALADGENIPVVHARDLVIGGAWESAGFVIDIEAYYKQLENIQTYNSKFNPTSTYSHEWLNDSLFANGKGLVRGLDVLLQKKLGVYSGWISYSLSEIRHQFSGLNQGNAYFASHDHRHQLKWVNMLSLPKWDFSFVMHWASGKPYTEIVGFYAERISPEIEIYQVAYGKRNGKRLPAYHRMDLSANYHFPIGKTRIKIGGSILNLLDRTNIIDKTYWIKTPTSKRETSELNVLDKQALGFSPNIFLHFEF